MYTQSKVRIPNGFDEQGYFYSQTRLPDESLVSYRRRLLAEARNPVNNTEEGFIATVGRQVGLFDEAIFQINLKLDANEDPIASDPYVEVTSSFLRLYDDFTNNSISLELNLIEDIPFLRDIEAEFTGNAYFTITDVAVIESYDYFLSKQLRVSNSTDIVSGVTLNGTRSNSLGKQYITDFTVDNSSVFITQKNSLASVSDIGDYYLDETNGVLFTESPAFGIITYTYRRFPFTLYWQPVRTFFMHDKDIDYLIKDYELDNATGLLKPTKLNSTGAKLVNEIYKIHPLGWGK